MSSMTAGGVCNWPTAIVTDGQRSVPSENLSEADLVRRAQAGDEQAFARIVEKHQKMVFSVAFRMVRRSMDAEDVAQQVFIKVFSALKKFDMRSALSTWIYKIALNESYDYLRKLRSRRVVYEGDMSNPAEDMADASERAVDESTGIDEQSQQRDYLMKLLEHVSEEERFLLFQKEVEGRSVDELSEMTGTNGNTIKVKLFRARKKLVKASVSLGGSEFAR